MVAPMRVHQGRCRTFECEYYACSLSRISVQARHRDTDAATFLYHLSRMCTRCGPCCFVLRTRWAHPANRGNPHPLRHLDEWHAGRTARIPISDAYLGSDHRHPSRYPRVVCSSLAARISPTQTKRFRKLRTRSWLESQPYYNSYDVRTASSPRC